MAKIIIIYDTSHGNTKRVAELIAEGITSDSNIKPTVKNFKEITDLNTLNDYDIILIGSPNHFGGPTRGIKKFIDQLAKTKIQAKKFAVFDTYIKTDFEKTTRKLEQKIREKLPNFNKITPGLSIKVQDMKGPILKEELPKTIKFGKTITKLIK